MIIEPPPEMMVTCEALDTFQLKLVEFPGVITFGLASNEFMTGNPAGGGRPATVTVAIAVTLPVEFVAVKI
jgi:hypothetical protein